MSTDPDPATQPTNAAALRRVVADCIAMLAPEADLATLHPTRSLRVLLDIDSYDFLRLLTELHARLGVDIPEADYARVDSLDGLLGYLAGRLGLAPG
ncbi:acyl carrier protein [Aquabacterium sp.]|uniref:acyl carrier protein n=1 Tax=Aquabacterium sp. TaxID=1872578 RepID=UPI003784DEF2